MLRMWVRKEALLKAAGVGIAVEPAAVVLDGTNVIAVPSSLAPASRWSVTDIPLSGHAAALVVEGQPMPMRCLFFRRPVRNSRR